MIVWPLAGVVAWPRTQDCPDIIDASAGFLSAVFHHAYPSMYRNTDCVGIRGPADTPYEGGEFRIELRVTDRCARHCKPARRANLNTLIYLISCELRVPLRQLHRNSVRGDPFFKQ